jgi:transcription elongation factor Elf1
MGEWSIMEAKVVLTKTSKKVPKCPKCNEPMDTIHYEECGPIIFDEESGRYVDGGQSQQTIKCGSCGQVIGGWRGDGEHWGFQPEREW